MPTILNIFGLRFYFYSDEHLPIHVHIEYGDNDAKVEIATRKIKYNRGIKANDMRGCIGGYRIIRGGDHRQMARVFRRGGISRKA